MRDLRINEPWLMARPTILLCSEAFGSGKIAADRVISAVVAGELDTQSPWMRSHNRASNESPREAYGFINSVVWTSAESLRDPAATFWREGDVTLYNVGGDREVIGYELQIRGVFFRTRQLLKLIKDSPYKNDALQLFEDRGNDAPWSYRTVEPDDSSTSDSAQTIRQKSVAKPKSSPHRHGGAIARLVIKLIQMEKEQLREVKVKDADSWLLDFYAEMGSSPGTPHQDNREKDASDALSFIKQAVGAK